jgi:glutamate mutase epsilon subunit
MARRSRFSIWTLCLGSACAEAVALAVTNGILRVPLKRRTKGGAMLPVGAHTAAMRRLQASTIDLKNYMDTQVRVVASLLPIGSAVNSWVLTHTV